VTGTFTRRAVLTHGLILLAVGVERLTNACMLQGSAAGPVRLVLGLAFATGGALLVTTAAFVRQPSGGSPPDSRARKS
jgi:hypothetical protein